VRAAAILKKSSGIVPRKKSGFVAFSLAVRILIVEDNDKTAGALKTGLQSESFEVTTTPTGEEGFFLLNSEPFDLVAAPNPLKER
jgi:PleD family two-component response regulator